MASFGTSPTSYLQDRRPRQSALVKRAFDGSDPSEGDSPEAAKTAAGPDTSSPSSARGMRMRTRHVDAFQPPAEEPDASKGGRSLRKKTRIDYTSFDHLDDDDFYEPKATPGSTRTSKKRKPDSNLHDEEFEDHSQYRAKRRPSEQTQKITIRRNAPRKSTFPTEIYPSVTQAVQLDEDGPAQDTIEVGGHHSETSDETSTQQGSSSSSSYNGSTTLTQSGEGRIPPSSTDRVTTAPEPFLQEVSGTKAVLEKVVSQEPLPQDVAESVSEPAQVLAVDHHADSDLVTEAERRAESNIDHDETGLEEPQQLQLQPQLEPSLAEATQEPPTKPEFSEVQLKDVPKLVVEAATSEPRSQEQLPAELGEVAPDHIPAQEQVAERVDAKQADAPPYANLTPYVDGKMVFYPNIQNEAELDGEQEIARSDAAPEEAAEDQADLINEDTPVSTPAALGTGTNSPAPEIDIPEAFTTPKKQVAFKKLRPASEFTNLFENIDALSHDELYRRLAAVNKVLVAWQNEYKELRKITDDEDNSIRYKQEEASFQHRHKMATSKDPDAIPVRRDFVVKGIRAPKPEFNTTYARQQDKIMASAYLFDYDDRESKIGAQDPIGQRGGVHKTRLRDRPKQTLKAAEADEPTITQGKRTRKPVNMYGDGEAVSRSSTPAPTRQSRGRQRQPYMQKHSLLSSPARTGVQAINPETTTSELPKKRGKGGRPRKHPLPATVLGDIRTPEPEPEPIEEDRPSRKRKRRNGDTADITAFNGIKEEPTPQLAPGGRRRRSFITEIPPSSFYSQTSASSQLHDERPNTSSSTVTASSTVSNGYRFREKRQKHFSNSFMDEEDGDFEEEEEETRKTKRVRRVPKKVLEDHAGFIPSFSSHPHPAVEQEPVPSLPKFKIKNGPATTSHAPLPSLVKAPGASGHAHSKPPHAGNGHAAGTTTQGQGASNVINGIEGYTKMTKSEKMSASMKARWSSGSMSAAVEKRRATLAKKKALAMTSGAAGAATGGTPTPSGHANTTVAAGPGAGAGSEGSFGP